MPMIDDRGRLFGRLNLVDAALGALVLVLLPAAYGAYRLFKEPPAKVTEISPVRLQRGPNLTVYVHGLNFRPYMRVSFNDTQAQGFFFASAKLAAVPVPDLPPGQYDVVLYDYMQEVSRLPKALTILPLAPVPTVTVEVTGAFKGLAQGRLKLFKAGDRYMTRGELVAELLSLGAPTPSSLLLNAGPSFIHVPMTGQVDLPAALKVRCAVVASTDGTLKCLASGPVQQSDVLPGSTLSLAAPDGWATFQIEKVLAEGAQVK